MFHLILILNILYHLQAQAIRCCYSRREPLWQGGKTNCQVQLRASVSRRPECGWHRRVAIRPLLFPIPDNNRDLPRIRASARRLSWRGVHASCCGNPAQK